MRKVTKNKEKCKNVKIHLIKRKINFVYKIKKEKLYKDDRCL